jgi:Fe-S oxidoreductase
MKRGDVKVRDIGTKEGRLADVSNERLLVLPPPYDGAEGPVLNDLSESRKQRYDTSLDGFVGLGISPPATKEEEGRFVARFLSGLKKLFSADSNWTFLQPLILSTEYCAKCQNCSDACPVYIASGRQEAYRPTFRSEVFRRLVRKYVHGQGAVLSRALGNDVDLNWKSVVRLGELAYRCTMCRRCTQVCPMGIDNALIAREIRKVFSQEMGIAPDAIHESGTVKQLKVGSSTGMTPKALTNIVEFMEDEIEEKTGRRIAIPVDKKGADVLLLHNAGEFMAWPENVEAFAIILDAAGVDWTLSSELAGYDAVNYGIWYDDVQTARVAVRHMQAAKELGVRKVWVGECGHAHKAMMVIADRFLTGDLNIPRESTLPFLADLVVSGRLRLDPDRNRFPVTLHDPCNMVRLMGIVEPQRRILRAICPDFREMEPHGVQNYCCGGGSGFAIIQGMNFPDWRNMVAGRMKLKQILDAFSDAPDPGVHKYVCAPCSNCKGQIRDLFAYFGVWEKSGILYGGLVELIANAMVDLKEPMIKWEWR